MRTRLVAGSLVVLGLTLASLEVRAQQAQRQPPPSLDQLKAMPTPRDADGKPVLMGWWGGGGGGGFGGALGAPNERGDVFVAMPARDGRLQNLENDSYISQKSEDNVPQYKPEYWSKVRDLDLHGNLQDPAFNCKPQGVPRQGPPNRIVQLGAEVILFNGTTIRDFRVGQKRNPDDLLIETWNGVPEGRWDGDTLIVESIGFNDQSWLGWGGFFHSFDMKVTETFTRVGNALHYTALVEDPVLIEPWHARDQWMIFSPNQNATIPEATPCEERDKNHIVNNRRG